MKVISKTLFCISIYNFVFVNTSIANRATVPDQSIALNCKKDEVSHRDIDNLINNFWSKAADEGLAVSRIRNIPQYSNFNYGVHYTEDKNELLLNIVGMPEECSKKIKKGKLDSNDNTFSYKIEGKYEDLEKCMDEQFQLLICKHEKCVSKSKKPKKHVNNIDNDELAKLKKSKLI
jgi:hypothetical protein